MIIGLGTDIIESARLASSIERSGQAFLDRVFTPGEQAEAEKRKKAKLTFLAGRWAAKEALAKALGCGFGEKCSWLEIEVAPNPDGKPIMTLSGNTLSTADRLGVKTILLSISHENHYVCATVVLA